jgi:hypothetical protein
MITYKERALIQELLGETLQPAEQSKSLWSAETLNDKVLLLPPHFDQAQLEAVPKEQLAEQALVSLTAMPQ